MFSLTLVSILSLFYRIVYEDGKVCISILHNPGEDENQYESADERWRPILGVEAIIMSVISMLASPNDESPANIDAAVSVCQSRFYISSNSILFVFLISGHVAH